MRIKDISITAIRRSTDGKRILGDVTFLLDADRRITLNCDAPYSTKIRADAVLIGDAIRQLRKEPEIRSGAEVLRFDPGLRPLATTRNALGNMDRRAANG